MSVALDLTFDRVPSSEELDAAAQRAVSRWVLRETMRNATEFGPRGVLEGDMPKVKEYRWRRVG